MLHGLTVLPVAISVLDKSARMPQPKILNVVLAGITHADSLLLIKRRKPPYAGHWGLVGGKMEFGESVAQAAEREAREETQLPAKFRRVKGVVNENLIDDGRIVGHFVIFVCQLVADHTDHQASDEGELRWFTRDELAANREHIIPTDYRMIQTMLLRDEGDIPFAEASMREDAGRYEVLRFDVQPPAQPET